MDPTVRDALNLGSVWVHDKTQIRLVIPGGKVNTLPRLLAELRDALPIGDPDRVKIEKLKKLSDSSTLLSKVICGRKNSTYGWSYRKD